jgi:hypothetical protein
MTCTACPLALDPFGDPVERLATFRPAGPGAQAAPRLAFYLFDTGPAESPSWVWIPAFRAFTPNSRSDPGAVLAKKGYRPELVTAPLGAALARTPAEARALAAIRLRAEASAADLRDLRLVSLPCRVSFDSVTEKTSGFAWPAGTLRPAPG